MVQQREKETAYRKNRLEEEFLWSQVNRTGRISFYADLNKFQLDAGAEYRETETTASGFEEENQPYTDLFLDQKTAILPGFWFGSFTAVTLHDDAQAIRGKAFFEVDFSRWWSTKLQAQYSDLLPETSNLLDHWIAGGYDILDRLGIFTFVPGEIPNSRFYSFSNSHSIELSKRLSANIQGQYLHHQNFHIPFQDARYYLNLSTLPGAYFLFTDQTGERLNIRLNAKARWNHSFQQTLGFYWNKTLDGDKVYKSYWKTIPSYLIRQRTTFSPYPDLEIQLDIQVQSKTTWEEFRRLDGKMNRSFNVQFPFQFYRFKNELPAMVEADLMISKWFW